jgi:hypothetical protein
MLALATQSATGVMQANLQTKRRASAVQPASLGASAKQDLLCATIAARVQSALQGHEIVARALLAVCSRRLCNQYVTGVISVVSKRKRRELLAVNAHRASSKTEQGRLIASTTRQESQ